MEYFIIITCLFCVIYTAMWLASGNEQKVYNNWKNIPKGIRTQAMYNEQTTAPWIEPLPVLPTPYSECSCSCFSRLCKWQETVTQ